MQEIAIFVSNFGANQQARSNLHALLGTVTLEPRDGVLWAHPAPNAKDLVETKPLHELSINRQKMVAGRDLHCSDSGHTSSLEVTCGDPYANEIEFILIGSGAISRWAPRPVARV